MKILLLDIETAPNLVHVWGLWQQNVGLNQIIDAGYVLCWSAKWYGAKDVYFDSVYKSSPKKMLAGIHTLMNEADAVVHYNGTKFDIPTLNKEFLLHNILPPAPYKQMDLLQTAKRQFRFPSNKLDYIAQRLKLGKKVEHEGHELWIKCMNGDKEAWNRMEEYNKNDVTLLERVYEKLLPWIKRHANYSLFNTNLNSSVCPHCGGVNHVKRGYYHTLTSIYQRYKCKDCGTWFKDNVILNRKEYKTMEIM